MQPLTVSFVIDHMNTLSYTNTLSVQAPLKRIVEGSNQGSVSSLFEGKMFMELRGSGFNTHHLQAQGSGVASSDSSASGSSSGSTPGSVSMKLGNETAGNATAGGNATDGNATAGKGANVTSGNSTNSTIAPLVPPVKPVEIVMEFAGTRAKLAVENLKDLAKAKDSQLIELAILPETVVSKEIAGDNDATSDPDDWLEPINGTQHGAGSDSSSTSAFKSGSKSGSVSGSGNSSLSGSASIALSSGSIGNGSTSTASTSTPLVAGAITKADGQSFLSTIFGISRSI